MHQFSFAYNESKKIIVATYVKLQDAYFSEANHVGNWAIIGYTAPGTASGTTSSTTNFTYEQKGDYANNTIATDPTNQEVWRSTAKVVLNDCGTEDYWYVEATVTSAKVSFNAKLSDETNCLTLTPTFKNIGK